MDTRPIGVFDSGIGGLTVLSELIKAFPNESFIYLGDTARVPYGTRNKEIITQFALELETFMLQKEVKAMVVACNTISATCLDEIQKRTDVPVLGVIDPAVKEAINQTKSGKIGVIGTRATIKSGIYQNELLLLHSSAEIIPQACPLFVPLVEEMKLDDDGTKYFAREYLKIFESTDIDTLILGCTHYPMLKTVIQQIVGSDVILVDSAHPTANMLKEVLKEKNIDNEFGEQKVEIYLTDSVENIEDSIRNFLRTDQHLTITQAHIV